MSDREVERLREAGEWWLRLQEDPNPAPAGEWLGWAQKDSANLDAFDRIEATALELRRLNVAQRAELAREFSPVSSSPLRRVSVRGLSAWLLAASVVLIMSGAIYYVLTKPTETLYSTGRSLHQNVILSDGSRITVGASTVVTVRMRQSERFIQLRDGEAYFEVKKQAGRPFVVDAGDITVNVIGTTFDVRRTGGNVSVSVTEGHVRVARADGNAVEVNVGESVAYDPHAHRFKLVAIGERSAASWRERRLEFVNERLDVVIANVNRYAGFRIAVDGSHAAQLTFTGTVLPDNLSSWLAALPKVLPVRVEQHQDEVLIRSAE